MYTGKEETVCVEVELVHGGIRYVFQRKSVYRCTDINKVFPKEEFPVRAWIYENGDKIRSTESPYNLVQKILPETLSEYFFFDGEHIEKLHQSRHLRDSISVLMGLKPLSEAVRHLNRVSKGFISQCSKDLPETEIGLKRDLKNSEKALDNAKEVLERERNHVEALREFYENAERDFEDNKKTIEYSEKIKKVDSQLKTRFEGVNNDLIHISELFNDSYYGMFSYDLIKKSIRLLDESQDKNLIRESVPGINKKSIDSILNRGTCICGSNLASNPELIENLNHELNFVPPHSIGTEIHSFKVGCRESNRVVPGYKKDFERRYITYMGKLSEIDDLQTEYDELELKSTSLSDKEASDIAKIYSSYKEQYNRAYRELPRFEAGVQIAEGNLKKIKQDIEQVSLLSDRNKVPLLCSKYTDYLINDIQKTIDIKEENIFNTFSTNLEDIFGKMYHGKRSVSITEDYKVIQHTKVGETSMSAGTKVTLGFAFVATLLTMAREELDRKDPDVETEPYPLVMDAPTSDLDATHIGNTFEYISEVAEQVIIMMTDKDWEHAKNALGPNIDKIYRLKKHSETHTEIIEEV